MMAFRCPTLLGLGVLIVFLCCGIPVRGDLKCQTGWTLYYKGETCIRHYRTPSTNWQGARTYCHRLQADLVRIDDQDKQDFFNAFHKSASYSVWLGLKRDVTNTDSFRWLDDTVSTNFTYWLRGEPNNIGGNENCVVTYGTSPKWNDGNCNTKHPYVCEKPATHTAPSSCPSSWLKYGTNCFRTYTDRLTWTGARTLCNTQSAELATIPDSGTTAFINKYMASQTSQYLWIGLNDRAKTWQFRWSSGNRMLGSYKNWASGQPDNANRNCVTLWTTHGRQWDDTDCDERLGAICEKPSTKEDIQCPYGFDMFYPEKKCLMVYQYRRSWNSARSMCHRYGAELAKIDSDAMNNYLQTRLMDPTLKYWIGLHKGTYTDKVTWLDEVLKPTYNKADTNTWNRDKEYCATITKGTTTWDKSACTDSNALVCERKAFARVECPKGYTVDKQGVTCYKLSTEAAQWEAARTKCHADGGDLVVVYRNGQNAFITNLIKSTKTSYWIGLHDRKKDNQFQWLDQPQFYSSRSSNWGPNQPNDTAGLLNCVVLNSVDGQWYDSDCAKQRQYVCEHRASISGTTRYAPNKLVCLEGWTIYTPKSGTPTCFKYNTEKLTWSNARKTCQKTGGDLIKIDNNDLANAVNKLLIAKKATVEPFIGLNDRTTKGTYVWLDEMHKATFTNWHQGEPSTTSENCAVIIVDSGYDKEWNDLSCDTPKGYICQQEATVPGSLNCGPGWEDSPGTDYCYRINTDPLNWREARSSCRTHGGELTSIGTPEEMLYLAGRLRSHDLSADTFWSGGNALKMGSGWRWSDSKPFPYFNWNAGEPSYNQSRDCISVDRKTGRWTAASCAQHLQSICKKLGFILSHPTPPPVTRPTSLPSSKVWGCQPTWKKFGEFCYAGYRSKSGVTWDEANVHCHLQKSNLVSVSDISDNRFLVSYLPRDFKQVWIGLSDIKRRNSFSWSDNVTPVTFTNWRTNQPSNRGLPKVCVSMSESDGTWGDLDCNDELNYVVCKTAATIHDKSEWEQYQGCKKGGKGYFDKCYKFYSDLKSFDDAQKACQSVGGNLATLKDRYIQAFVSSNMPGFTYWIGLSNTNKSQIPTEAYPYTWQSGAAFDFANWDRDHMGLETSTCVAIKGTKSLGFWHNYPCDQIHKYICEYPRPGHSTPVPMTTTALLLPCPTGWTAIGQMCYKKIYSKMSWMGANSHCQSLVNSGGSLASIINRGMEDALGSAILKSFFGSHMDTYWIGLNDRDGEGGYKWAGGEVFAYENWGSGEPNNQNNKEDCVQLKKGRYSSSWNDYSCFGASMSICQAPRGSQLLTTLTPPTVGSTVTQCGEGSWTMYNGYCYSIPKQSWYNKEASWFDARDSCRAMGAQLASIGDDKENGYLTTLLSQKSKKSAWIGLNDFDEDVYKWVDRSVVAYLAWAEGEPNDAGGERCVLLDLTGVWNDMRCTRDDFPFICKKRPGSFSPITLPSPTPDMGGCPRDFYGMPGTSRCFQLVGEKKGDRKSLDGAILACKNLVFDKKSRLASLHSTVDQEFITTMIADLEVPVWIGFESVYRNSRRSNQFQWVDNTKKDYVHWAAGAKLNGRYSAKCVDMMITPKVAGDWSTMDCFDRLPYICEYSKSMLFPTNAPNLEGCPKGYTRYRDSCYMYVSNLQNWTASEETCSKDGGHLATEQGGFDKAFIDLVLQKNEVNQIWIGMTQNEFNAFSWSSNAPVLYTDWDDNQPDLALRCVGHVQGGRWRTEDCSVQQPSLCQIPMAGVDYNIPKVPGKCLSNIWTLYGGYCYYLETKDFLKWDQASTQCKMLGGELASMHDSKDAKIVAQFLAMEGVDAWVGMRKDGPNDGFSWSDGSAAQYYNWAPGSPSTSTTNNLLKSSLNCVLAQAVNGKWTDAGCYTRSAYICKVKQIDVPGTAASTTNPTTTKTITTATTPAPSTGTPPNPCQQNPCHHGRCIEVLNSSGLRFLCHCATGWTGTSCDQMIPKPTTRPTTTKPSTHSPPSIGTHFPVHKPAKQTSDNDSQGLSSSGVAGVVVGVLCLVAIVGVGAFLFKRRQDNSASPGGFENATGGFDNAVYNADAKNDGIELESRSSFSM